MSQDLLTIRNLAVNFNGLPAVDRINLSIAPGEVVGVVGESGSGKSVTMMALMGLIDAPGKVTADEVTFNGVDLLKASPKARRKIVGKDIAMVFQDALTSLNPSYTVGYQIKEVLKLHEGLRGDALHRRALELLDQVGIPDAKNRIASFPHQMSGGMNQRVMIAMAVACNPKLLIADEPTTALDVTIQAQILQLVRGLQDEMNMGVIFITHDMGVVAEVADRVLVMYRGEKVEEGESDRIFAAPEHRYTRALLAAVPKLGSMQGTDAPEKFPLLKVDGANAATPAASPAPAANDAAQPPVDPSASPILRVRDLVTRFPVKSGVFGRVSQYVHAVERVSFELRAGETLALVGESGCGKSTTGRSLLRLVESQSGSIEFDGRDISAMKGADLQALRRNIQFIFQDPFASLNPRLTVGFSIMEPLLVHGVASGREAQARVDWLLDKVGLPPEAARRYPHEFSGGQRQRIAIARALALNPKVVIADESVSALDVSVQAQIVNLMLDLQRELGVAYLFISHDMAVVERISHRVAVMYLGQIVEIGPRRAVFEAPQHPYTKKLMSAVPVADPARRHAPRQLAADEIPSPIRAVGDDPVVAPLVAVGPDHYVATHRVGGAY